jgi:hypothetical protein
VTGPVRPIGWYLIWVIVIVRSPTSCITYAEAYSLLVFRLRLRLSMNHTEQRLRLRLRLRHSMNHTEQRHSLRALGHLIGNDEQDDGHGQQRGQAHGHLLLASAFVIERREYADN